VPREYSSGERQPRGPITKAGHSRTRWLLIQAAVSILRRRPPQAEALRTWTLRIAARRGKQIAVVALARRLAGILYGGCGMAACSSPTTFGLLVPLLLPS
jgi:transposase